MPNGLPIPTALPSPKLLLGQQVASVRALESSLPAGVPQLSGMLSSVIASIPDIPIPSAAGLPAGAGVSSFIKSIEGALPAQAPSLKGLVNTSGFRQGPTPATNNGVAKRAKVMGGGYRSIS